MLIEIPHHARRRVQSKCAAAGEQNRLHLLHGIDRIQQIRLARPGRRPAHIHASRRALLEQQHGATGRPARLGEVTHLDALHVGDAAGRICFRRAHRRQSAAPAVSAASARLNSRRFILPVHPYSGYSQPACRANGARVTVGL